MPFDYNSLIGAIGGGNGIGDDVASVVGAFKGNQPNNRQSVYVPPPPSEPPYLLIVGALVAVVVLVMVLKK